MLSWIATDFFEQSPVLFYPVVALLLFIGAFMAVSLRTTVLSSDATMDARARLPLDGSEGGDGR